MITYRLQLPHGSNPERGPGWTDLQVRAGTSDEDVVKEVWVMDVYHLRGMTLERQQDNEGRHMPPLIIDLGAHTGIFSALCLQMWPDCEVIAVEPNSANFELLHANTAKWAQRISCRNVAIGRGHSNVRLVGDGATGHTEPDGGHTEQVPLNTLIGTRMVALLKCDVEGAEYDTFAACPIDTLKQIDQVVFEWHGTSEAPWVEDAPRRFGELVALLSETHAVNTFGRPSGGGYLFAKAYDK